MLTWTFSPYGLAPIFVAVSIINIQYNMMDEKNFKSTNAFVCKYCSLLEGCTKKIVSSSLIDYPRKFKVHINTNDPEHQSGIQNIDVESLLVNINGEDLIISGVLNMENDCMCNLHLVQFTQLLDPEWKKKEGTYYYRFLLPHEKELLKIQSPIDLVNHYITISFPDEKQIHVFWCKMEGVQYLVIESRFPCTYSEMSSYRYVVSLSLGLLTGIAPLDYVFVIASKVSEFDDKLTGGFIQLAPTIQGQFKLLRKERPMSEQEFSGLVSMLHRSKDLARATMMLLVASLDIDNMGPTYSVVLETICSVLYKENKDFFKPFLVKKEWGYDFKKNGDKLTKPFELQQIAYELSDAEKKIIKTRNNFLHGGITEEGKESMEKLLYIGMELRKLCCILLLRYSGYKGPILNNAVEMKLEEALKNKEPLFITYEEKTEDPQPTKEPEASV